MFAAIHHLRLEVVDRVNTSNIGYIAIPNVASVGALSSNAVGRSCPSEQADGTSVICCNISTLRIIVHTIRVDKQHYGSRQVSYLTYWLLGYEQSDISVT